MPKSGTDKIRLIRLIEILKAYSDEEHPLSVADITGYLEEYAITTTRQTVYKDVEDLRGVGYDIVQTRTPKYGYWLRNREFDLAELKLMVDAVQSAKFISGRNSEALINKLGSMTSVYRARKLKRQVYILDRASEDAGEKVLSSIDRLHEAISGGVQVSFRYYDRNAKKERVARHEGKIYTLTPCALIWDDENYYLVAYDPEEGVIKHFRVDKIGEIIVTDRVCEKNAVIDALDLSSYSKQVFGMFGGRSELVTLECVNSLAGVMIDRFGEEATFFPAGEGRFSFSARVNLSPNFYSWITAFGTKVKITAPEYVRNDYRMMLDGIKKLYE